MSIERERDGHKKICLRRTHADPRLNGAYCDGNVCFGMGALGTRDPKKATCGACRTAYHREKQREAAEQRQSGNQLHGEPPMAQANLTEFARDAQGEVLKKTYRIPFRPEYVLVPKPGTVVLQDMQPLNKVERGGDLVMFRFHVSEEAVDLVRLQDPNVTSHMGYCTLSIHFDSAQSGPAVLELTRGVQKWEVS